MICKLDNCTAITAGETIRYCSTEHKRLGLSLQRKGAVRNVQARFGLCSDCRSKFQAGAYGPMPKQCEKHRRVEKICDCGISFIARPGKDTCNACSACVVCGGPLPKKAKLYCSDECQNPAPVSMTKSCRDCGKPFDTLFGYQVSCSEDCTKRHNKRKRRSWFASAVVEEFDFGQVCERDAWTCQLCSEEVDRELVYPHPFSRSLDHIVPISLGGAHNFDNAQLAHLRCNISKGNRVEVAS